jgi:hypothetical protein
MNKQLLMIAFLMSAATAFGATLKEKLATHNETIETIKQKARAGEILAAQDDCKGSGSGSGSGDCNSSCTACKPCGGIVTED